MKQGAVPRYAGGDSLHGDCFGGTLVDTGFAVHTEIGVDLRFAVFHGDGLGRADVDTGFTAGTLFNVNLYCQCISSDCTCAAKQIK